MGKLDWRVNRMKEIYSRYKDNLSDLSKIKFFAQDLENTTPWFIDVKVENREELMVFLKQNKIDSLLTYNIGCSLNFINSINSSNDEKIKVLHPITYLNNMLV